MTLTTLERILSIAVCLLLSIAVLAALLISLSFKSKATIDDISDLQYRITLRARVPFGDYNIYTAASMCGCPLNNRKYIFPAERLYPDTPTSPATPAIFEDCWVTRSPEQKVAILNAELYDIERELEARLRLAIEALEAAEKELSEAEKALEMDKYAEPTDESSSDVPKKPGKESLRKYEEILAKVNLLKEEVSVITERLEEVKKKHPTSADNEDFNEESNDYEGI